MGLLGKLGSKIGLGTGRSFYARDYRNAYQFRPDVNPPRQKFQGYVNFILNRKLYDSLYGSVDNSVFRTQISSLLRKASLPDITFKTEIKNAYNRKKVVTTGVEYDPITLTVIDTVGNEWLSLLMQYYSYHFMNVRNKTSSTRDPQQPAGSLELTAGSSKFGKTTGQKGANNDQEVFFDSNAYGYNINEEPNFFERIDFVLYHANKGVQYSIINPTMKSMKMGDIDYASSDILEFELTFDYENFVPYSTVNFELTDADVQRFEQGFKFVGPAFEKGRQPISMENGPVLLKPLGSISDTQAAEGKASAKHLNRAKQPEPVAKQEPSANADNAGKTPASSPATTSPPASQVGQAATADAKAGAANPNAGTTPAAGDKNATTKLPDVYGNSAQFAKAAGKSKKETFFENLLGNAAGAAVGAALGGKNIKNAVVGSVIGTGLSAVSNAANDLRRPARSSPSNPPPSSGTSQKTPGG